MMNEKFDEYNFVFMQLMKIKILIKDEKNNVNLNNVEVISDENIKKQILSNLFCCFKIWNSVLLKFVMQKFHLLLSIK